MFLGSHRGYQTRFILNSRKIDTILGDLPDWVLTMLDIENYFPDSKSESEVISGIINHISQYAESFFDRPVTNADILRIYELYQNTPNFAGANETRFALGLLQAEYSEPFEFSILQSPDGGFLPDAQQDSV